MLLINIMSNEVGYIAKNPESEHDLALAFDSNLDPEVRSRLLDIDEETLTVIGRSALGQIGVDLYFDSAVEYRDALIIPIEVESHHSETARRLMHDIRELPAPNGIFMHNGERLPFGRLLDTSTLERVGKEEIERSIREKIIIFGETNYGRKAQTTGWVVNEDGSVTLPLAHLEFLFNHDALNTPEKRLNIVHHGRAGLRPYVDTLEPEEEEVLALSSFAVGGVLFSAGPYAWMLRKLVSEGQYLHLDSVRFSDGNRAMGLGSHLPPYERHRQVELAQGRKQQPLNFKDARVTIDFLKSKKIAPHELSTLIDWTNLTAAERNRLHLYGLDTLRILRATDPALLRYVFDRFTEEDLVAAVITPHGVTGVDVGETAKFNARNIAAAVLNLGTSRRIDARLKDLEPLSAILAAASDRSRVVIADSLTPKYIASIAEEQDVGGILVRHWRFPDRKRIPDREDVALSKEDHSTLTGLVRHGTSIGWFVNDEMRLLHPSGMWAKPEIYEQLGELEVVIAMYGGHKEAMDDALADQVYEFIRQLAHESGINPRQLAIAHGNGMGLMLLAHRAAVANGILDLGVSIDVEDLGQGKPNLDPSAVAFFLSRDRLYRQQMLDIFNTISIFNIGGFGTLEEFFITLCSQKLFEALPVPKILIQDEPEAGVDPAKFQGLYANIPDLIQSVTRNTRITSGGRFIDLAKGKPLGPQWVGRTVHLVDNYETAKNIIRLFLKDPNSYWRNAGISTDDVEKALRNQTETLQAIGFNPRTKLARSAEEYIATP